MKRILILAVCALGIVSCANDSNSLPGIPANKKEIMDRFVAGTLDKSYVPAAFFVHYGSGKTEGEAAVRAHIDYFLQSNQDILKVQFEQRVPQMKGLEDGSAAEKPELIPEDFYRPTLEIVKELQRIAGQDVYVLPTIYNPFQVSRQSMGDEYVTKWAVEHPDALKAVFDSYKKALLWLVDECKKAGIEGFYTTTQGGEKRLENIPGFFDNFIKAYDLEIMGECNKGTKLNILHICDWEGEFDDLTRFADYPGQIVNTPFELDGKPFTTSDAEALFHRPILGGLERKGEIVTLPEGDIPALASQAIDQGPSGKIMLGAECTVSDAPLQNIHATVSAAHHRPDR